jgi:hypothetical protein
MEVSFFWMVTGSLQSGRIPDKQTFLRLSSEGCFSVLDTRHVVGTSLTIEREEFVVQDDLPLPFDQAAAGFRFYSEEQVAAMLVSRTGDIKFKRLLIEDIPSTPSVRVLDIDSTFEPVVVEFVEKPVGKAKPKSKPTSCRTPADDFLSLLDDEPPRKCSRQSTAPPKDDFLSLLEAPGRAPASRSSLLLSDAFAVLQDAAMSEELAAMAGPECLSEAVGIESMLEFEEGEAESRELNLRRRKLRGKKSVKQSAAGTDAHSGSESDCDANASASENVVQPPNVAADCDPLLPPEVPPPPAPVSVQKESVADLVDGPILLAFTGAETGIVGRFLHAERIVGLLHKVGVRSLKATCKLHRNCTLWLTLSGQDQLAAGQVAMCAWFRAGLTATDNCHWQHACRIKQSFGMRIK